MSSKQFYKKWQFWVIIAVIIAAITGGCFAVFSNGNSSTDTGSIPSAETTGWSKWLKQYESWVDKYVAVYKKYKANPSDTSVQSEYLKLAGEASKWAEEGKKFSASDMLSSSDMAEFTETYNRILEKIKSMND